MIYFKIFFYMQRLRNFGFVLEFGKFKGATQTQKVFFYATVIKYEASSH